MERLIRVYVIGPKPQDRTSHDQVRAFRWGLGLHCTGGFNFYKVRTLLSVSMGALGRWLMFFQYVERMPGGSELLVLRLSMADNVVPPRLMACIRFETILEPDRGRSIEDILNNDYFAKTLFTSFFEGKGVPVKDTDMERQGIMKGVYDGTYHCLNEDGFRCRQFLRASTGLSSLPLGTPIRVSNMWVVILDCSSHRPPTGDIRV